MDIPTQKTVTLAQASRFCEGLRLLGQECGLSSVIHSDIAGVIKLKFNDGSSVGITRAAIEAGWIPNTSFRTPDLYTNNVE